MCMCMYAHAVGPARLLALVAAAGIAVATGTGVVGAVAELASRRGSPAATAVVCIAERRRAINWQFYQLVAETEQTG